MSKPKGIVTQSRQEADAHKVKVSPMTSPTADALIANVDKARANRAQALEDAKDPPDADEPAEA